MINKVALAMEAQRRKLYPQIPADFPVKPLLPGEPAEDQATCFTCGMSWDDAIITSMTPAPAARCPFEQFHPTPEMDKQDDALLRRTGFAAPASPPRTSPGNWTKRSGGN